MTAECKEKLKKHSHAKKLCMIFSAMYDYHIETVSQAMPLTHTKYEAEVS